MSGFARRKERTPAVWIFTKYGFFSAVCARQGDGSHFQPVDPDRIMVRARLKSHLTNLKQAFPVQLADCEIMEFPGTDYAYRIFVSKEAWAHVVTELTMEMDYDNFKSKVASFQGADGADYEHALHEVWSVMNRLQN